MTELVHELFVESSRRTPAAEAVTHQKTSLTYAQLADQTQAAASLFLTLGLGRGERVAVYLEKREETVIALFGAAAAGGVFVPINPLLKSEQVAYILQDCNVRILVTSAERVELLAQLLGSCHDLRVIVLIGARRNIPQIVGCTLIWWDDVAATSELSAHRVIDSDMAAILYTSGSTGKPKGVVLSHRNIVAGARSVAQYLELDHQDRILSVLPLSFDYGLNQITTAFLTGAKAVLMNYLLPRDVIWTVAKERITGLAAVPPLWIQLAQLSWPDTVHEHLRYITNSGGAMPGASLAALRKALPKTKPFLMYGLTEAFRSTYLPPSQLERRPDSIGKAIPNAEIMVVREDGSSCAPGEPGELVHRGVLVSLGYWNDPDKTAERFRPVPRQERGLTLTEMAVWSGDTVRTDEEGFVYFVSRRDEMIKTSGYRVSPTEIEEVLYATKLVVEVAAFGVPHLTLGQAIIVIVVPSADKAVTAEELLAECRTRLPTFMVPSRIEIQQQLLPRNPNGKIDRKSLAQMRESMFDQVNK
jgi:acyl-CoA ligase (AMP-forming) (exosortase A-associated)